MENFIKHFVRIAPGRWTCVRPGEFDGPKGRFQVAIGTTLSIGTSFMGMDMAQLLEEQYLKKNGYANPQAFSRPPGSTQDPLRPLPSQE